MKRFITPFLLFSFVLFFLNITCSAQNDLSKFDVWIKNNSSNIDKDYTQNNASLNYHLPIKEFADINANYYFEDSFSLFIVLKSNNEKEYISICKVYDLEKGTSSLKISNQDINIDKDEKDLAIKHSEFGSILKVIYKNPGQTKGLLHFEDFNHLKESLDFYEIIFSTKKINNVEEQQVESYLSLKYGIGIKNDYLSLNRKDTLIQKSKVLNEFNHNVFALGNNKVMTLNQKQAQFSQSKLLSVALNDFKTINQDNDSNIKEGEFIIFGDNNQNLEFKKNERVETVFLKRIWKASLINSDDLKKQHLKVTFDIKEIYDLKKLTTENYKDLKLFINNNSINDRELITPYYYDEDDILYYQIELNKLNLEDEFYLGFEKTKDLLNDDVFNNSQESKFLSIYPNPVVPSSKFKIAFKNKLSLKHDSYHANIYSSSGKYLKTYLLDSHNDFSVDAVLDNSGVYTISIYNNDESYEGKVIVK